MGDKRSLEVALATELRRQLRHGFAPSALMGATGLLDLAPDLALDGLASSDRANQLHQAVGEAIQGLPAGEAEAASVLLGIDANAELSLQARRARAAARLALAPESFRRHRQARLLESLARQLLVDAARRRRPSSIATASPDARTVLVIGAQQDVVRSQVFGFLQALGLQPLSSQEVVAAVDVGSARVTDALRAALDLVQAAVVVLEPDGPAGPPRPNILLELGMVLGMAPARTIILAADGLALPSDIVGLHVLKFGDSPLSRKALLGRLEQAGCQVDPEADIWRAASFRPLSALMADLSGEKALAVAAQLADAVSQLHANAVVHADIRPENVLVSDSNEVRLIDYGRESALLGRHRVTAASVSAPQTGATSRLDPAVDVFALAVIVAGLIAESPRRRRDHDLVALLDSVERVPSEVVELLRKALATDPALRPSASKLADALAGVTTAADMGHAGPQARA